jgi:hypothetical protein
LAPLDPGARKFTKIYKFTAFQIGYVPYVVPTIYRYRMLNDIYLHKVYFSCKIRIGFVPGSGDKDKDEDLDPDPDQRVRNTDHYTLSDGLPVSSSYSLRYRR